MNIHNINTIARYEVKLLRRSWLFRIFAILAILGIAGGILFWQTGLFNTRQGYWNRIALSSFMPFVAVYLYNIAQSIIAIFLAGNFLKRDKKLDTAEVIYVRPMSNADYVIGKIWGILKVFLSLNAIVLIITAFFNITINQSPFDPFPYLFYLFTISLPSLLFILGLSFTVMCIFKNQAITFVIMLGIIGTVFFKLSTSLFGVFDFFGIHIPTIFSDVTGHGQLSIFLLQRLVFLIASIGLICFTIGLIKRLPHKPWKIIIVNSLGAFFLLLACVIGSCYIYHHIHIQNFRKSYIQSFNQYADALKAHVLEHHITITPQEQHLIGKSEIKVINPNSSDLQQIIFYLNPALEVQSITNNQQAVSFDRDNQLILVHKPLPAQQELFLEIQYAGAIDEKICYTDIPDSLYWDNTIQDQDVPYQYGKRYAWLEENFTLLTPECLWYPVTIPPVNPESPYHIQRNFSQYQLTVKYSGNKTVLSQGKGVLDNGKITFTPSTPLSGISLTIADYEKRAITVDSIDYELLYFKGHDYFSSYFTPMEDTLAHSIQELRNETEHSRNRNYPFKKFVLAETPIQFATYNRSWKGYTEYVMPEIVFIPERGATLNTDFKAFTHMMSNSPRGATLDAQSVAMFLFSNFVRNTFTSQTNFNWSSGNNSVNKLNIAPLFFQHIGFVRSEEFPIIDLILSSLQQTSNSIRRMSFGGMFINDKQRANFYLSSHSLKTALSDRNIKPTIFNELLQLKSEELQNHIKTQMPLDDFKEHLEVFLEKNLFQEVDFNAFLNEVNTSLQLDLYPYLKQWFLIDRIPTLYIREVDANQVVINEETQYQVKFKVNNPSNVDAIIEAQLQSGFGNRPQGGGRMTMSITLNEGSDDRNLYTIPAGQAKEIKIITENQPASVRINMNIANNLPATASYSFPKIETVITDTLQGCFDIDPTIFKSKPNSHEIIIDNESPNFKIIASNNRHKLKDWFQQEEEEKYSNFNWWRAPSQWTHFVADYCYGETVYSAVYKNKGSGNNSVQWIAEIPQGGYYEIAIWNPKNSMARGRFGGGGPGGRGRDREERNQTYTVVYGEESESITLDLERENNEWVPLGNFYLPQGNTTIILTDKVSGRYVIADAVKFTRTDR